MILPQVSRIAARQFNRFGNNSCSYYSSNGNCRSRWSSWGRWVLVGIIGVVIIAAALAFLCCRRRRRARGGRAGRGLFGFGSGGKSNLNSNPMTHQSPTTYNNQTYGQQTPYTPQYNGNQGYNAGYAAPEGPPPQYGVASDHVYPQREGTVEMPASTYHPGLGGKN